MDAGAPNGSSSVAISCPDVCIYDAYATFPETTHPRVQAFLRVVAMVQRIAVNKVNAILPFGLRVVEVPLDSIREG